MPDESIDNVVAYHDRTKHHPNRFARSLGYLDWATQPDPFRRFDGAELVRLVIPDDDPPPYDDIYRPGAIEPSDVNAETISRLFYLSLAISAWKQAGPSRWALRCDPSSGNLHPTEGYAILPSLEAIGDWPSVYHYAPKEHGLERRAVLSDETWKQLISGFPPGSFLTGLSSVHWRETWKYGERAFRYCQHDTGHALACLRIAAAVLGWQLVVLEELSDDQVAGAIGLDRTADFDGAEQEHPDVLCVVVTQPGEQPVPRSLAGEAVKAVAESQWYGKANQLSPDHVEWDVIDIVTAASLKRRTAILPAGHSHEESPGRDARTRTGETPATADPRPVPHIFAGATQDLSNGSQACEPNHNYNRPRSVSAQQIIRQRRSAVAFDGETSISDQQFYRMMKRVVPSLCNMPWDSVTWPVRVHLCLFVHLVDGLAPGLYILVRDPNKRQNLQDLMKPEFEWARPESCPESLPLWFLLEADCRRAAAQLSLGQEIAGMSAFSLGMVAEFDATLEQEGAWAYRRLFWEAGMVGQVLYLEAEAAGIRATGIGAYFDDLVHDVFGLSDHRFQSMYHFTVGGPIDDERLTTLPAYPAQ